MNHRKQITVFCSFMVMLVLILDGKTACSAAAEGIELCIKTVIPSLFLFLFLSSVITDSFLGERIPLLEFPGKLIGIPMGAESLLVSAVMGGYPAGARAVGDAYANGVLDRRKSEQLLTFCSITGPAFIFGMLSSQFSDPDVLWALWLIQILSSFITALQYAKKCNSSVKLSSGQRTVSQLLSATTKTMANICGWVLLFRILSGFLDRWFLWLFPQWCRVLFCGLLELSNGCCMLSQIQNTSLRFLICSVLLSFGGLCIAMQTASVIGTLSMKPYLFGKLLQTGITFVLSLFYLLCSWTGLLIGIILFCLLFIFFKKVWISERKECIIEALT